MAARSRFVRRRSGVSVGDFLVRPRGPFPGADLPRERAPRGEATPAMENSEPTVGILMYLHRRLDEVRTQRALRDLELAIEERYESVIADHAFFLNAQHLRQIQPRHRDEGTALLLRLDREPGVVRRYIIPTRLDIDTCPLPMAD